MTRGIVRRSTCAMAAACILAIAGCRQDMHDQPKYVPLRGSTFFSDGRSARPLVEGTVARGHLDADRLLNTGKENGRPADEFPEPVTSAVIARGRDRYDVFCSPCHDRTGRGQGMVVKRGYRQPPSLHLDRLRQAPPGHYFDVITNGFGAMPDYRAQIPVADRWAIAAYIRALQLSQNASLSDVPPEQREALAPGTGR